MKGRIMYGKDGYSENGMTYEEHQLQREAQDDELRATIMPHVFAAIAHARCHTKHQPSDPCPAGPMPTVGPDDSGMLTFDESSRHITLEEELLWGEDV